MLVQVWNTNIVHVKEQRWGLQKCRPRGGCGFCVVTGRERTFLPPTAFWKPDSPPLLATQHLFVLPTTTFFFFSSGLIHKDGNIGKGFFMAKAFLYGEALLTFILRGELEGDSRNQACD